MTRWLETRRAVALAIALSLVLAALSLGGGFVTDDYGFRAALHSTSGHAPPAWDLFRFQTGDHETNEFLVRIGRLAWWAAPDLKIHFCRPLTGMLFAADDALFGDAAVAYHVHSLLWFALLLVGLAAFYRRVLPPAAATLAVLVFGLAAAHTDGYAWLSARHAVVGGAGAAWSLALYVRGGRLRWLGLVALAIGLAGSESALGAVPLWCALAIARSPSWRARLIECLPPVVIGVAYLAAYTALGYGTRGSGGYHDPLADPVGFAALALVRVPILLGDAALSIPAELAFVASHAVLAIAGVVAVVVVVIAARALAAESRRLLAWLALGGLVALLPGVAGYPAGRVLIVPDIAFSAVLGAILATVLSGALSGALAGPRSLLVRISAVLIALGHLAWSPLLTIHDQRALVARGQFVDRVAAEVLELVPPGGRAILVASSDPFIFLYPRGVLAETSPGAVTCWSVLSGAHSSHKLTRTADKTFTLEALDQPLLDGSFDELFRSADRPFTVGDAIDQCGATIRIAAVDRGLPTKLEITYQRRLDDPKLVFLVWRADHLERLALPPVGESITLPPAGRL